MTAGLEKTFELLSGSRNDSASPVLLAALESDDSTIFEWAIRAIVMRRSKVCHLAVLARWHELTSTHRELVLEGRGKLSGALRDAVLSDETQLFENACEVVEEFAEYDLIPTLVTLAENQKSPHAQAATALVLKEVNRLCEMVQGPRDYNDRRNPESIRRYVMESLERSVERFNRHQRAELIEAFVILGGASSSLLRSILESPHHLCYATVVNTLSSSKSAGVIELLISFLKAESTSLNLLNIISRRTDEKFILQLLNCTEDASFQKIKKNLHRIRSFSWVSPEEPITEHFGEEDQARCVKLITASGIPQDDLLEILTTFLGQGEPAARLAVCEALISIPGDHANHMVLDSIADHDPRVQAVATQQLRNRHVPGAMAILLKQIDSPHEVVRSAARESLSEFSFKNYLASFDALQDEAQINTGKLVLKVDPETVSCLTEELDSPSIKRRMRAIEIIEVLKLTATMSGKLIELLDNEDHLFRSAIADVLQFCPTAEVQEALRRTLSDRSGAVQNAAKSSLAAIEKTTGVEIGEERV